MQAVNASDVVGLFAALEHTFATEREFLIALDGKVGDSDLGITMSKSFAAAHATVAAETLPVRPLTTLETVMALTPARTATSRKVVIESTSPPATRAC